MKNNFTLVQICSIYNYVFFDNSAIQTVFGDDLHPSEKRKFALRIKKETEGGNRIFVTERILREIKNIKIGKGYLGDDSFEKLVSVMKGFGKYLRDNNMVFCWDNLAGEKRNKYYRQFRNRDLFEGASEADFDLFLSAYVMSQREGTFSAIISNDNNHLLSPWCQFCARGLADPRKFGMFKRKGLDSYEFALEL